MELGSGMNEELEFLDFPDEISWVLDGSDECVDESSVQEVPRILTSTEKKEYCQEFTRVEGRDFFFWFEDTNTLGDFKSQHTVENIKKAIDEKDPRDDTKMKRDVMCITIGVKSMITSRTIEMAIKIESKRAVSAGLILKKIYKMFPNFHGEIGFDKSDNDSYLKKARRIIAPTKAVDIDLKPLIVGEELYDLLRRIQNAEKKQEGPRKIEIKGTEQQYIRGWMDAAKQADGSWAKLTGTSKYINWGWENPLHARAYFDHYAYEIGPYSFSEEVLKDIVNGEDWDGVELECGQQRHDWFLKILAETRARDHDRSVEERRSYESQLAFREMCKPTRHLENPVKSGWSGLYPEMI